MKIRLAHSGHLFPATTSPIRNSSPASDISSHPLGSRHTGSTTISRICLLLNFPSNCTASCSIHSYKIISGIHLVCIILTMITSWPIAPVIYQAVSLDGCLMATVAFLTSKPAVTISNDLHASLQSAGDKNLIWDGSRQTGGLLPEQEVLSPVRGTWYVESRFRLRIRAQC